MAVCRCEHADTGVRRVEADVSDPGWAEKRAKWQRYFEGQLTGTDAEVRAATDAAMEAMRHRADVDGVIQAGLAAARHFRETGAAPRPATVAPPPAAPAPPPAVVTPRTPNSYATPSAAAGAHPPRKAVGSASSGIVSGLQQRQEMLGRTYFTVWNFRLERTDEAGRSLPTIPVEMKGRYFHGAIANGDLVDIGRAFSPGKLVRTDQVRNVTVGVDVKAVGRQFRVLRGVFIAIFLVIFLCVFGLILSQFLNVPVFELLE